MNLKLLLRAILSLYYFRYSFKLLQISICKFTKSLLGFFGYYSSKKNKGSSSLQEKFLKILSLIQLSFIKLLRNQKKKQVNFSQKLYVNFHDHVALVRLLLQFQYFYISLPRRCYTFNHRTFQVDLYDYEFVYNPIFHSFSYLKYFYIFYSGNSIYKIVLNNFSKLF